MQSISVAAEDFPQYLDQEDALKRLGGNRTVFHLLLRKFLDNAAETSLRDALEAGDTEGAGAAAHTIKGLAANLSMPALRDASAALEQAMRAGEPAGDLPEALYQAWGKTVFTVNAVLAEGG